VREWGNGAGSSGWRHAHSREVPLQVGLQSDWRADWGEGRAQLPGRLARAEAGEGRAQDTLVLRTRPQRRVARAIPDRPIDCVALQTEEADFPRSCVGQRVGESVARGVADANTR